MPESFHQYGFIANSIKSDKERLSKKYDADHADDEEEWKNPSVREEDTESEQKYSEFMDFGDRQCTAGGPDVLDGLRYSKSEYEDANYYKSIREMERKQMRQHKENDKKESDEDIMNDVHKSKEICHYVKYRDFCEKYILGTCPYKYHPQMETNVDFGNDDQKWTNPNNNKIVAMASARRQPVCIRDEFISYIAPGDAHKAHLSLQDVLHNCFVLRITVFKCKGFINKGFYEQQLSRRFGQDRIEPPRSMMCDTAQDVPYPLILMGPDDEHRETFISPLHYTQRKEMTNSDYRASMIHFLNQLNANHGEHHLEAFCLQACLINYPPIFIIEDFHVLDMQMLRDDIVNDEQGKVWQVLKKLSEGNLDKSKWRNLESSGKGGSGRGGKGDLDKYAPRAAGCRDLYCMRGQCNTREGRNASFMEIYIDLYYSIDFLNMLKEQELGSARNRFEWVKTLKVTPLYYHLVVDQEKSCRMFRLKEHLLRAPITFLRVEFQSMTRQARFSDQWEYGSFTRQQAYDFLTYGFCCGGAKYDFFFFSDGQLRDKCCWLYSIELSRAFHSIKALRGIMGDFEKIHNPGKKMSRMGLYNTKSTLLTSLKLSDLELIDDPQSKDGIELTDGCCIISSHHTNQKLGPHVVSMLARLGGAKCMLVCLPPIWIKKVIERDQARKRKELLALIEEETKEPDGGDTAKLAQWDLVLKRNENRNFNAQAVITKSSMKFQFEKYHLEVAVKSATESSGAFTNKEFIGAAYYHYHRKKQTEQFEQSMQKYALKWFEMLNAARGNKISRHAAEIFLHTDPHKGKNKWLLRDIEKAKHQGAYRRKKKRGQSIWDDIKFLTSRSNESDRTNRNAKQAWEKVVTKLRIHLPWPSCRMEGVADWTQTLKEQQIFLKMTVPPTVKILCQQCKITKLEAFSVHCEYCNAPRPEYFVYQGECGMIKNPCLHPRSYKRFTAVYNEELDALHKGECLLFSTSPDCETSPVFAMSGADLDGDDFLVVTQQDLIPLPDEQLADISVQGFDDQGQKVLPEYIDDYTIVDYFLEYALHENTGELSMLHEAFSEHNIEGIGHPDCISIARYHSFALDFPKTGMAAIFPDDLGIPNMEKVQSEGLKIWPHYQGKHPKVSFHSKMIKGRFYDFVREHLPQDLLHDYRFRRDAKLPKNDVNELSDEPCLQKVVSPQKQQQYTAQPRAAEIPHWARNNANNNANNNGNDMVNRQRHEDLDKEEIFGDYHWLDGAMYNMRECADADERRNDNSESDDASWIQETDYTTLDEKIKSKGVRQYLKDGERLTKEEIKELQSKLNEYMKTQPENSESRYEAFHVDYYYEAVLSTKGDNASCSEYRDNESNSAFFESNEAEEEKMSVAYSI